MEVLAIHGIGADSEAKANEFGVKVQSSLAELFASTGSDAATDLHVTSLDYSQFLDTSPWRNATKVRDAYRHKWPASSARWACECCDGNLGRSVKGRATHLLAPVAEDKVIDQGGKPLKGWLRKPEYRKAIRDHLRPQIHRAPDVVIAHSLGSVIGLDLLSHWPDFATPKLFLTLGSPLSMESVWSKLPGHNQAWLGRRDCNWLNLYDRRDHVTHNGSLPSSRFPGVINVRVRNVRPHSSDRAHQISRYLSHDFLTPLLVGLNVGSTKLGDLQIDTFTKIPGLRLRHS